MNTIIALWLMISTVKAIPKLAEKGQGGLYREVTAGHLFTRCMAGCFMLGSNLLSVALMLSIGADENYLTDMHDILEYGSTNLASSAEQKTVLVMLNMSRSAGIWAGSIAGVNMANINHIDEHTRKTARLRCGWGIALMLVLTFPEFWLSVSEVHIPALSWVNEIIASLRSN